MNNYDPAQRRSGRIRFLLLAAIFAAPVLGAYLFYFYLPELQPTGRTNQGHLIVPAKPIEVTELRDMKGELFEPPLLQEKWTLLQIGASDCREVCQRMLWNSRQVRTSLGRRMTRVQRVYVATDRDNAEFLDDWFYQEHSDLQIAFTDHASADDFVAFFSARKAPADSSDYIYLIDPNGNWLMYYTPEDEPGGMLKDLKKLLKLSGIG